MAHAIASRSLVLKPCSWGECRNLADHPDHPLCEQHFRKIGLLFIHENLDTMRVAAGAPSTTEWLERFVASQSEEERLERQAVWDEERAARRSAGVVYYLRMGDHVKIGTTTNVKQRMQALYVIDQDALLATEPGGADLERRRHQQFAAERWTRELFAPSRRLLEHIESLRSAG